MSTTISPESAERLKKQRRKHKNSKLGCLQCKERRMKCSEELPECRNCRIRQVKIPCSYLSFTEKEKKEFIVTKDKQSGKDTSLPSPTSSSPSESTSKKQSSGPVTLSLVRHFKPDVLESQKSAFNYETPNSVRGRMFLSKMLNDSFFKFEESFNSHFALTTRWLVMQMEKRMAASDVEDADYERTLRQLDLTSIHYKSVGISYIRKWVMLMIKSQEKSDFKMSAYYYSRTTIPSLCLQVADIWSHDNIRQLYISGSLSALNELYENLPSTSPTAVFIAQTFVHTNKSLFVPNYGFGVLEEILDVLREMVVIVNETQDDTLIYHWDALIEFFEEYLTVELLEANYNPKHVTAYPAKLLYNIYHKFVQILPSEAFTMTTTEGPVQRVVYAMFYMIARVLDNIFPETRYITKFRFIGPTSVYPFTREDLFDGLSHELSYFANYASRLLSFFSIRADLFGKYMGIQNLFPDSLAENRFKSRKIKVREQFISSFKNTLLTPLHYPQVLDENEDSDSPSSQSSFSMHFSSSYPLTFEFENTLSLDPQALDTRSLAPELPDLFDTTLTGLLVKDYDPLQNDMQERPFDDVLSLAKYVEDYNELMKHFIE